MNFLAHVLSGRSQPEDIEHYIACWHDDPHATTPLFAYLGMSEAEYARWVENLGSLRDIIAEHRDRSATP